MSWTRRQSFQIHALALILKGHVRACFWILESSCHTCILLFMHA
jgi:hypothetical protein